MTWEWTGYYNTTGSAVKWSWVLLTAVPLFDYGQVVHTHALLYMIHCDTGHYTYICYIVYLLVLCCFKIILTYDTSMMISFHLRLTSSGLQSRDVCRHTPDRSRCRTSRWPTEDCASHSQNNSTQTDTLLHCHWLVASNRTYGVSVWLPHSSVADTVGDAWCLCIKDARPSA